MFKFTPHPGKQTEFLASTCDRIFYGGARGGAKSFGLAWKAGFTPTKMNYTNRNDRVIDQAEYDKLLAEHKYPKAMVTKLVIDYPDYVALLIRRTFPQLLRNFKPECDKLYPLYAGKWQERHKRYVFPSGAMIYLVHCQDRRALDDYIGGNYNFIGIDEANMFPEDWVDSIESSCRSNNPEIKAQLCLTSNPGRTGHLWLKKKYVDKCKPIPVGKKIYNEEFDVHYQPFQTAPPYIDSEGISHQYIPATVFDNPSILENDPKYVRILKNLKPTVRAMWLEGRWDVIVGMFFNNWDESTHVIDYKNFKYGKHFTKETHSLYRFYDYGTKEPFVCLFAAVDENGRMIIFDEIVKKGLSSSRQAQFVNSYTLSKYGLRAEDFTRDIADPAYWIKHSEKSGMLYSPAMFYQDEGITLMKGSNDRMAGSKIVYNGFEDYNGLPRIRFTDNCINCIEHIPALPESPNNCEDVDSDAMDHEFDALKYGASVVLAGITIEEVKKLTWRERLSQGLPPPNKITAYEGETTWVSA